MFGTSVVSSLNDQLARHPAFAEDDLELLVMQKKVSFRYCCHNHRDTINGKISVVNMAFHINVQSCKDILKSACTVQVQPIVKLKKYIYFHGSKVQNLKSKFTQWPCFRNIVSPFRSYITKLFSSCWKGRAM